MLHEQLQQMLFLSKDKQHLLDRAHNIVAEIAGSKGHFYYRTIGIESEAFEKICTGIKSRKVCISWNEANECQIWRHVDVCTQYELLPKGFSNIS
ncbi:hypothetical protein [Taibaiella helva]|uniref:hypothetical protein n=1 Tax=Taibaiella helva TaxID=2301235 RepID=UPI000E594F97|nr:hypothetical protein [Taibaiella helva]